MEDTKQDVEAHAAHAAAAAGDRDSVLDGKSFTDDGSLKSEQAGVVRVEAAQRVRGGPPIRVSSAGLLLTSAHADLGPLLAMDPLWRPLPVVRR